MRKSRMFNPPHPGRVLKEYLSDLSVTEAAAALGTNRPSLSRILNGRTGISADMALRLEALLGIEAEFWLKMQLTYELWQASQHERPPIKPLRHAAAF